MLAGLLQVAGLAPGEAVCPGQQGQQQGRPPVRLAARIAAAVAAVALEQTQVCGAAVVGAGVLPALLL